MALCSRRLLVKGIWRRCGAVPAGSKAPVGLQTLGTVTGEPAPCIVHCVLSSSGRAAAAYRKVHRADSQTCIHAFAASTPAVWHESAWLQAPLPPPPGPELQSRLSTWAKHGSSLKPAAANNGGCALGLGVGALR